MQPTYLPWAGYFNLISKVDKFVFLDDVQFERQSWQSRNRIALNGIEYILSTAVKKHPLASKINKIQFANNNWRKKNWLSLLSAYEKSPYGYQILELLEPHYKNDNECLISEFNQNIITEISKLLCLRAKFYRSSLLACEGDRSDRILNICSKIQCEVYLSPAGAKDYLESDGFQNNNLRIKLIFQNYETKPYNQFRCKKYIDKLSIIDVIANLGISKSKIYIEQGDV